MDILNKRVMDGIHDLNTGCQFMEVPCNFMENLHHYIKIYMIMCRWFMIKFTRNVHYHDYDEYYIAHIYLTLCTVHHVHVHMCTWVIIFAEMNINFAIFGLHTKFT